MTGDSQAASRLHAQSFPSPVTSRHTSTRSTGQSGHWLQFAQDVSRRDKNTLDEDVKLFFAVGKLLRDG